MKLRHLDEQLAKHRQRLDYLKAMIESGPSKSSPQSNSESTTKSNLDVSQEQESDENFFQAHRRKILKHLMHPTNACKQFVRFQNLWASFRSKTSASSQDRKKLSKNDIILI